MLKNCLEKSGEWGAISAKISIHTHTHTQKLHKHIHKRGYLSVSDSYVHILCGPATYTHDHWHTQSPRLSHPLSLAHCPPFPAPNHGVTVTLRPARSRKSRCNAHQFKPKIDLAAGISAKCSQVARGCRVVAQKKIVCTGFVNQWSFSGEKQDEEKKYDQFWELSWRFSVAANRLDSSCGCKDVRR